MIEQNRTPSWIFVNNYYLFDMYFGKSFLFLKLYLFYNILFYPSILSMLIKFIMLIIHNKQSKYFIKGFKDGLYYWMFDALWKNGWILLMQFSNSIANFKKPNLFNTIPFSSCHQPSPIFIIFPLSLFRFQTLIHSSY